MNFKCISCAEAKTMIAAAGEDQAVQIVDVRDPASYAEAHIERAIHLDNTSLSEFLAGADRQAPLLVYCYHGHMSQSAAAYLAEQGFDAYSLDGGFEAWREEKEHSEDSVGSAGSESSEADDQGDQGSRAN